MSTDTTTSPHVESGHNHVPTVTTGNQKRLLIAWIITGVILVAEVVGGILANSLVLLADAGHVLVDFLALGLAWIAFRIARRPPDSRHGFGYHRFPVLAAFVNGMSLFFISAVILYEAITRLVNPPDQILGGVLFWIALAGLVANLLCYWILSSGKESNLNVRSAALHVLGDLLGSIAAVVAAGVILVTQWKPIDPILSMLVCLLILFSAWKIVAKSGHVLLQGTPEDLDVQKLREALTQSVPELIDVHQVHVWELAEGKPVVTLHARASPTQGTGNVLGKVKEFLSEHFDLYHSVVQVEEDCPERSDPSEGN